MNEQVTSDETSKLQIDIPGVRLYVEDRTLKSIEYMDRETLRGYDIELVTWYGTLERGLAARHGHAQLYAEALSIRTF